MPATFSVQKEDSVSPFWTRVEGVPNVENPEADDRNERQDRVATLDVFNAGYVPSRSKLDEGCIGRLKQHGLTENGAKALRANFGCGDAQDVGEIGVSAVTKGGFSAVQMLPTNDPGPGNDSCPYLGGAFGRDPAFAALLWDIPELNLEVLPPSPTKLAFIKLVNAYGDKEAIDSRRDQRFRRETVRDFKVQALRLAFDEVETRPPGADTKEFDGYLAEHMKEGDRLLDYAMFMTLRHMKNIPWQEWAPEFKDKSPTEILSDNPQMEKDVTFWFYTQWTMGRQWKQTAEDIHSAGGYVMMDRAYSVLPNNAEVWRSYRESRKPDGTPLFELDKDGNPTAVSGVNIPGDPYGFQKWGHVLLRFKDDPEGAAAYIVETLDPIAEVADIARIDHWLGLGWQYCRIWEEAGMIKDQYHVALRHALFSQIRTKHPSLYIVAEDVGAVTDEIARLRKEMGLSGMASPVLMVSGDNVDPRYGDVSTYSRETVAYTDNHDSKAIIAWYDSLADGHKDVLMHWMYCDRAHEHRRKPFVVRDYVRWMSNAKPHFFTMSLRTLSQLETETTPDGEPVRPANGDNRAENRPGAGSQDFWQLMCTMTREEMEAKMEAAGGIIRDTRRSARDLLAAAGEPRVLALEPRAGAFSHAKPGGTCVIRLAASAIPKDLTAVTLTSNLAGDGADGTWPEVPVEDAVCKHYKDGTYVLELSIRIPADAQPGKLYDVAGSVKWDGKTQQLCKLHGNMKIMVA
jgi:4-alpha-glucanotransferase